MVGCQNLIEFIGREFLVEQVTTTETLGGAQRLRYQVFCKERNILPGHEGVEADFYDPRARHVVLRHRRSDELVGTARVVHGVRDNPWASLPIQHVCDPSLLRHLPLNTTGEVSRFALRRVPALSDVRTPLLLRLALMQGVLRASRDLGLTHWCAVMETSLLRLLRTASVNFEPIGPIVEYYGRRQPAVAHIDTLLINGRDERPAIWQYVTDNGALAPRERQRLAA